MDRLTRNAINLANEYDAGTSTLLWEQSAP